MRNVTEGKVVRITAVVDANNVDTEAVTSWSGDSFDYNVLMETYPDNQNAYVPLIEQIAAAASITVTLTYVADFDLRADVRRNAVTAIQPFTQDSTFPSTGRSIAAIRNTDEITT